MSPLGCKELAFRKLYFYQCKLDTMKRSKELSFCHKLWFSYPYIFAFQCRRPYLFQTMNHFRSNNDSLKYHRLTPLGCKYIAIWKSEFVAKTQFLCAILVVRLCDLESSPILILRTRMRSFVQLHLKHICSSE